VNERRPASNLRRDARSAVGRSRTRPDTTPSPTPIQPPRGTRRLAVANLVAGVFVAGLAVGGFGYALTLLYEVPVPLVVCLAAGLVAATAWAVLRTLPVDDLGHLVPDPPGRAQGQAAFADLSGLEALLGSAVDDQDRFDHRVRPALSAIATDLLRQRHGLHWPAHRAQIERLVRPGLWQLLTAPPASVPTGRAQIASWIEELEQLNTQPADGGGRTR